MPPEDDRAGPLPVLVTFLRLRRWVAQNPVALCAAAVAAALFVSQTAWLDTVLIDDAYISFSFSKNLALGNGPVYSHGLRVEGYSNFLWVVLVAIPLLIDAAFSPLLAARVMAVPFALMLAWATHRLVLVATRSQLAAAAALLVLGANTDLATAFLSGLETLPYAALVTLGFALYVRSLSEHRPSPLVVPVFVAAALMRIDGMVPLAFVLAFETARRVWCREGSARDLARWALPALAVYAAWFAWRFWYYGLPLPSTYYAKALIPKLLPRRGAEYVWASLRDSGLVVVLPAIGLLLWRRRGELVPVILFVLGHLVYVARVGGDWMPFDRFVLPVVPLALALIAVAATELAEVAAARGRAWGVGAATVSGATFVALGLAMDHRLVNSQGELEKLGGIGEQQRHVAALREAVPFLNAAVPPGRRLVTDYGGVFGYYSHAEIIEQWGLCNAAIATRGNAGGINPIYGRTCPECYKELDPEFFHVEAPIIRPERAFKNVTEVLAAVWQSDAIGRHIDIKNNFIVGRVRNLETKGAVFFLEKKGLEAARHERQVPPGFVIDYPFESP